MVFDAVLLFAETQIGEREHFLETGTGAQAAGAGLGADVLEELYGLLRRSCLQQLFGQGDLIAELLYAIRRLGCGPQPGYPFSAQIDIVGGIDMVYEGGETLGHGQCMRQQLIGWQSLVDQADALGLVAIDMWAIMLEHAARYGAGEFNVAQVPILDALLPVPTPGVIAAGWLIGGSVSSTSRSPVVSRCEALREPRRWCGTASCTTSGS